MSGTEAPPHLDGMEQLLRDGRPPWLEEDLWTALGAPAIDPIGASLVAGRLLRSGGARGAARAELERWVAAWVVDDLADIVGMAAETELATVSSHLRAFALADRAARAALAVYFDDDGAEEADDPAEAVSLPAAWPWELLSARDDVESHLVTLGCAAIAQPARSAAVWERRLVDAAERLDRVGLAIASEIDAALRAVPSSPQAAWLSRAADSGCGGWWLAPMRRQAVAVAPGEWQAPVALAGWQAPAPRLLEGDTAPTIWMPTLQQQAHSPLPSHAYGAALASSGRDAVALALAQPRSLPVARLFDDRVEVFAVGTGDTDEADGAVGLILVEKDDHVERIADVEVIPALAATPLRDELAGAWWVSLAGAGDTPRELVVSYRERADADPVREVVLVDPRPRGS